MSRELPLLSRHSEMLGLAMETMPRRKVVLDQKSACRKNQNSEACTACGKCRSERQDCGRNSVGELPSMPQWNSPAVVLTWRSCERYHPEQGPPQDVELLHDTPVTTDARVLEVNSSYDINRASFTEVGRFSFPGQARNKALSIVRRAL